MGRKKQKLQLKVSGMHCASCEVLIERKLKSIEGIESVKVNQAKGKAELTFSKRPNLTQLQAVLQGTDYQVSLPDGEQTPSNTQEDYLEIGLVFLTVLFGYLILKNLNILPKGLAVTDSMSYPFIFAIGLVAAVSSCIAVTGGLLVAVSSRYAENHPELQGWQKFKPQLQFNLGRVLGYTLLGGLVGAIGSVLTLSTRLNGILIIMASAIMVILGLQILNIFPNLQRLMPKMPKFLAHRVHDASISSEGGAAPFLLGSTTFFLPCGFTQALQLYVLSRGSFTIGALTMLAFSLGTLPALISLSALSSFLKGSFQKYFFRFAGVIVVILGLSNINNGLALAGVNLNISKIFNSSSADSSVTSSAVQELPPIVNGKQVIRMKIDGLSYVPANFTVRQGLPVEWHIDGTGASGCAGVVLASDFGISATAANLSDKTVIFTPKSLGSFGFSCPMGMTTRGASITVVAFKSSPSPSSVSSPISKSSPDPISNAQSLLMTFNDTKPYSDEKYIVKKNISVELTVNVQTKLSGCMSTMVSSDYDIAKNLKLGKNLITFTPTKAGKVELTCPMGIFMGEIIVTD